MVLELPYQPFPEATNYGRVHDYELVRPYLHSRFLRWSYGAMKGRPGDWEESLAEKPLAEFVAGAVAAGFAGLYVDTAGYPREIHRLETALSILLGVEPLVESRQKAVFFDLRPFTRRLSSQEGAVEMAALREATLTPPRIEPRGGISPEEDLSPTGEQSWWVTSHRSEVDLYEPAATQNVVFEVELLNNPGPYAPARPAHVSITWPDGSTTSARANRRGVTLVHSLRLRHGHNLVRIRTDAEPIYAPSDERTLYLQLFDPRFGEQAFLPFSRGSRLSLRIGR
jgi:phosphoglycerol transferase